MDERESVYRERLVEKIEGRKCIEEICSYSSKERVAKRNDGNLLYTTILYVFETKSCEKGYRQ